MAKRKLIKTVQPEGEEVVTTFTPAAEPAVVEPVATESEPAHDLHHEALRQANSVMTDDNTKRAHLIAELRNQIRHQETIIATNDKNILRNQRVIAGLPAEEPAPE